MPRASSRRTLAQLPPTEETWQIATARLRTWIEEKDGTLFRPYGVFVVDLDNGFVVTAEIVKPADWPGGAGDALLKAMRKPFPGAGPPRRPRDVVITPELKDTIAATLTDKQLEITLHEGIPPEEFAEIVRELEEHFQGDEPERPGLLSIKGVTPDLLASLFAAAAEFYRAAPWIQLTNSHILALRHPAEPRPRFLSVMGNGGVEYGLAVYSKWDDVERMFSGVDDPMEALPLSGGHSLLFATPDLLPFDDLDAIEQYGWEIAAEDAYPLPVIYDREGVRCPDLVDLLWYEAALRVIPIIMRDRLESDRQGDFAPLEASIEVPSHAGPIVVDVSYPAGELPLATRPVEDMPWLDIDAEDDELDDLPFLDRRAMEGMMTQLVEKLGDDAGTDDPELDRAQQTMYRAWEQTNPAKRIALAHEALSISPNCADAYVLLAEEEAGTLGRALELYRQGMAAGERALGPHYFKEFAGHFWGLLETRPYMRAREGLALTLWRLNHREEAARHYSELMRLNPNDNQGIRYALLDLLLELDRDDDAAKLIRKYREDWSSVWTYTRALLEFRKGGASTRARKALGEALEQNPHVPVYLTGKKRIPNRLPPFIGMGDQNEAVDYAAKHLNHWRRTPGAVAWLSAQIEVERPKAKSPARTGRKRSAQPKRKSGKKAKRK